jgi:hypothetical protein
MKKLIAVLIISLCINASASVQLTNFGTGSFTNEDGVTDFSTINQTATSIQGIGTDTNILAGTFSPVNIAGLDIIELTGFITGTNPNTFFKVELYNDDFSEIRVYDAVFSSFSSLSSTIELNFVSQTASFSSIAGFQLTGQGSGSALNLTLTNLQAVPEPSSALLIGLGAAGLYWLRRRRQSA